LVLVADILKAVLFEELLDRELTVTHFNLNLVCHESQVNCALSEFVNTLCLSFEGEVELFAALLVVEEVSKLLIDRVALQGHVER